MILSSNIFWIQSFSLSIPIFPSSILFLCSSNRILSLSLNSSKQTLSTLIQRPSFSCSCHSSINFIFLAKYSPTSFSVTLFFRLAFSAFLPISLLKLEVSSSKDLPSPSAIDVESGVGTNNVLNLY